MPATGTPAETDPGNPFGRRTGFRSPSMTHKSRVVLLRRIRRIYKTGIFQELFGFVGNKKI